MTIFTGTFVPYEQDKYETLKLIITRCQGIKKSLRFIEKDSEHLTVRCPLSGDYLDVLGSSEELDWVHNELRVRGWYRPIK